MLFFFIAGLLFAPRVRLWGAYRIPFGDRPSHSISASLPVATSMRRPARVKSFFLGSVSILLIADQREALGSVFLAPIPDFSNRRLALLPFALFVELSAPVPVGVLNLKRVLPSR